MKFGFIITLLVAPLLIGCSGGAATESSDTYVEIPLSEISNLKDGRHRFA